MAGSSRRSTRGFQAGTGKTDGRFWLQSGIAVIARLLLGMLPSTSSADLLVGEQRCFPGPMPSCGLDAYHPHQHSDGDEDTGERGDQ